MYEFNLLFVNYFVLVDADIRRQYSMEEEDDLLQFAIQQSLVDAGTEKEEVISDFPFILNFSKQIKFFFCITSGALSSCQVLYCILKCNIYLYFMLINSTYYERNFPNILCKCFECNF